MADNLLTLDPGLEVLAWAAWSGVDKSAELVELALSIIPEKLPLGALAMRHADNVPHGADVVTVEEMSGAYVRQTKTKAQEKNTNRQLFKLQAIGGIVAARSVRAGGLIQYTQAVEWKGSVPKNITKLRVERELSPAERVTYDRALARYPARLRHNLVDVVGIGLWYTRRIRVR